MVQTNQTVRFPSRLLQVVNTLAEVDGGPARNAFELNRAFNRMHDLSADLFWVKGNLASSVLMKDGKEELDLPSPGPRRISFRTSEVERVASLMLFVKSLTRARVVIIHGYYLWWTPILAVLSKALGKRVYLMPHGSFTKRQQKYSAKKKAAFDRGVGALLRASLAGFVTGSETEKVELLEKFKSARVTVAGVGVPMPASYKSRDEVGSPVRLLSLSRIAEKKRIDISIEAVKELQESGVECELVVAGSGAKTLTDDLMLLAQELGVGSRVSFVGSVSGKKKEELFLDSDFFLLPSEDENFGIGFAEAMSYGLPSIVSSNVAAANSMPSGAGCRMDEPNGRKIAHAIGILLNDEKFADAQVESRRFAEQRFSWAIAARLWREALQV